MADVALVPERDVLQRGDGIAANDPRETAQAFAGDRVALVRHRRTAFLPVAEKFFHFENFGPLQMTELGRPAIDARGDQRERGQKFRVPVALDDLGRKRRRFQAELLADTLAQSADRDARACRPRR